MIDAMIIWIIAIIDRSIFGIEEGDETVSDVAQKFVELLLGVESVSLVECGIIISDVFPYLLVDVVAKRRDNVDGSTD